MSKIPHRINVLHTVLNELARKDATLYIPAREYTTYYSEAYVNELVDSVREDERTKVDTFIRALRELLNEQGE